MPSSDSKFQETTTAIEKSFSCTACLWKKKILHFFCSFMQNKHAERRTHTIWLYAEIPMVWETGKICANIHLPDHTAIHRLFTHSANSRWFRNERIAKNKSVFRMWYVFSWYVPCQRSVLRWIFQSLYAKMLFKSYISLLIKCSKIELWHKNVSSKT